MGERLGGGAVATAAEAEAEAEAVGGSAHIIVVLPLLHCPSLGVVVPHGL